MVYCPHEKWGERSLYIHMQLILLYEALKFVAELLRHPVYIHDRLLCPTQCSPLYEGHKCIIKCLK